jgi:hypothetical protein
MKKYGLTIICLMILINTGIAVSSNDSPPEVRLPPNFVTMLAKYGTNSWFDMTFSDIPAGFDITNGTYLGWCAQENVEMVKNINHTVRLYSSYDPYIPPNFQSENWSKINYILNHKRGNRDEIQQVIWYYLNFEGYPSDDNSQLMITDANQNGSGFIPHSGEVIAILVNGVPEIQRTFFEYTIQSSPSIGHLVWYDNNRNGIQDQRESGIMNIVVRLYSDIDVLIKSTTTDKKGYYSFLNLTSGDYYLQFILPDGYQFSPQNVGHNIFIDSDANSTTGKTNHFHVTTNTSNSNWDAGMYKLFSDGTGSINHPPTADATAGEPYKGFVQDNITFNGSRSYDRDGRIVKWFWIFGDRTNGTGKIIKHAYMNPGTYTVILTVTDNNGANDSYSTIAVITTRNIPLPTPTINGPKAGHKNTSYNYTAVTNDSKIMFLQYIFDWNDKTPTTTTDSSPSGIPITEAHSWSSPGHYILKVKSIFNNSESATATFTIWIDVWDVANIGYLIDQNSDGTYDDFHDNLTGKETKVQKIDKGVYLIDNNGDGKWNYIYYLNPGELVIYSDRMTIEYLVIGLVLIIPPFLFLISRKKRRESNESTWEIEEHNQDINLNMENLPKQ